MHASEARRVPGTQFLALTLSTLYPLDFNTVLIRPHDLGEASAKGATPRLLITTHVIQIRRTHPLELASIEGVELRPWNTVEYK